MNAPSIEDLLTGYASGSFLFLLYFFLVRIAGLGTLVSETAPHRELSQAV